MDRDVKVRFYEIDDNDRAEPIEAALRALDQLPKTDRERRVGDDVTLRLEHLEEVDGLLIGDITRVQTANLPGHVVADDLDRLPVDRIGHSCAFVFDPATRCMAFQFDMRTGIGRMCRYLNEGDDANRYWYLPYLKEDTLARFKGQTPRRLRLKVARVRNFADLGDRKEDFEDQLEHFGRLFDAPKVEIVLSASGEEGSSLDRAEVWNTVRRWLGFKDVIEGIKNVEVQTLEADEAFNFLNDLLCEGTKLQLPDNNPLASRKIRQQYVRACYDRHRNYITQVSRAQ